MQVMEPIDIMEINPCSRGSMWSGISTKKMRRSCHSWRKKTDIPKFGVLAGVKIVHATAQIAGPIAAEVMAEMGADVVWIENSLSMDTNRLDTEMGAESERRNQRSISLNIPTPEGKKILFSLIKDADVFIENSKGGQFEKWGLTDEVLWEVNPKLVIAHLSGFGQTGDPSFVARGCYDPIAQAFSGFMAMQGFPDKDPNPAQYVVTDYYSGMTISTTVLAALYNVQRTGVGESIDIAQYEVALRFQNYKLPAYLNLGLQTVREGSRHQHASGWGTYRCKDGNYVYLIILGLPIVKKAIEMLGLEYGTADFPKGMGAILRGTHASELLEERLEALCEQYTAKELEDFFWPQGVPCCRVLQYSDLVDHPHYIARGSFIEWDAVKGSSYEGRKIKGVVPPFRFKRNPCQVWRGCPTIGMDNDDVLAEAGFTPEEIQAFYEQKIIYKAPPAAKKKY